MLDILPDLCLQARYAGVIRDVMSVNSQHVDPEDPSSPTIAQTGSYIFPYAQSGMSITAPYNYTALEQHGSVHDCELFSYIAGMQAVIVRAIASTHSIDPEVTAAAEATLLYHYRKLRDLSRKQTSHFWLN